MAAMLETPSRIWRRIEAVEGRDMPSLPSLPAPDDSEDATSHTTEEPSLEEIQDSLPLQSTPAPLSARTNASTIRPPSSTSSTVRFAHSITSRASKSSLSASNTGPLKYDPHESFNVSVIPALPGPNGQFGLPSDSSSDGIGDGRTVPEIYVPSASGAELNGDLSERELSDVRHSSHPSEHSREEGKTPHKIYDYSISLRSERQASPYDKLRNVSFRRPLTRARTPSLTRTTPSPTSTSSHSTPHSTSSTPFSPVLALSIPLPPSTNASPSGEEQQETRYYDTQTSINFGEQSGPVNSVLGGDQSQAQNAVEDDKESSREPTFSSEEAPTMSEQGTVMPGIRSPASVAFSSPAPSAMFTPTPVFQPRPRARFSLPPASITPRQQPYETDNHAKGSEIQSGDQEASHAATPGAHKRTFLLSVINSTARPKMKWATPHPDRAGSSEEAQGTGPSQATPGVSLRAAFAGVTPRPPMRGRLSHPLSQAWPADEEESVSAEESAPSPAPQSPYDPTIDRASFISTGSSHDLTTHARANASFDPVMGLGEHGHGVGRFNANKLNNYLHGLNRRLQEENESLVARLKDYEERFGKDPAAAPQTEQPPQPQPRTRRPSGGGRRVSMGPELGDVAEDMAEGWIEEKAALEDALEEMKSNLEECTKEKDAMERKLKEQFDERERDKERWRERMKDVESGVEKIIRDLEMRAEEAEKMAKKAEEVKIGVARATEKQLAAVVAQNDALTERLQKAESALEGGKDLGSELTAANERVGKLSAELQNAKVQIAQLEDEVMRSDAKIDALDKELRDAKSAKTKQQDELKSKAEQLSDAMQRIQVLNDDMQKAQEEVRKSKMYIAQVDTDATAAVERIEALEKEVLALQDDNEGLLVEAEDDRLEIERLSDEASKAAELARQLEEALKAAESKMLADEQELLAVKGRLSVVERSSERLKDFSSSSTSMSRSTGGRRTQVEAEVLEKVETLQQELDDAHKEVARLNTLLSQSPARRAIEKAKDSKISQLEQEKDELVERLKSTRQFNTFPQTPGKMSNMSGLSPMHRQILAMSFKSPKTPGGPLQDLSWLQSTMNDPSVSPLVAEIARLQQELDRANESIDDKLDKLGDTGLDVVVLTKRLEEARARIVALEEEIAKLTRMEDKRSQRLRKVRCSKCLTKIDVQAAMYGDESTVLEASRSTLLSNPPTPPTKSSDALRASVEVLNTQLASMQKVWEKERRALLGEKAVLQDAANKLDAKIRDANVELQKHIDAERAGEKVRAGLQGALDKAERMLQDLEGKLKAERTQLKAFTAEQARYQREKEQVYNQLGETESAMAEMKDHLQRLKKENHDLEAELRANATAEQKARLLENKISTNAETIEQLRHERSLLSADHKELQQRFKQLSERVHKLRDEHAASQTSHDNRRHELELQRLELEDLRRAYSQRGEELARAESERKRVATEKADIMQSVTALQADLRRVQQEADAYGRDLKSLRVQKDKMEQERKDEKVMAERTQKQSQTQIRLLHEELEGQRQKASSLQEEKENHRCAAIDSQQLVSLKERHKEEARGLLVHIRYLKAAFARESTRCSHLSEQKVYLLKLLGKLERNEQRILAAIATVGFATPRLTPPPRLHKLKAAVRSVIFINRAKSASEQWQRDRERRPDVLDALQDVRRRRSAGVAEVN